MAVSILDRQFGSRLQLPLIAAPMFRVSGPELVMAACRAGVVGAFPTANARTVGELDGWLARMKAELGPKDAPWCPNLIMRRETIAEEIECLVHHKVEMVITSVGSPKPAVAALRGVGCLVLADVATLDHARKAIAAGADGLVLLTAGSGGQTGWANGFAFARAVRAFFSGPVVLAGGMSDGAALLAARALGCDLAYMGTRFIAAEESMAPRAYKQMLVDCSLDDVQLSKAFTGLEANMLRPSIVAAGLDPDALDDMSAEGTARMYGSGAEQRRWRDIWSAGHSVSGVGAIEPAGTIVDRIKAEYARAAADIGVTGLSQ